MSSRAVVSEPLPAGVRRTLSAAVVRPSWVALGAAAVLAPLVAVLPRAAVYAPFVASVLVFGLPHGAVDHLAPARTAGTGRWRSMIGVGLLYLVAGGGYLAWWFLDPVSAAVFFILLTWAHWGQGDVYALLAFVDAEHLSTRAERGLALVVRGGLPMVAPLAFHPAEYRRVASAFVALFGGPVAALDPFFTPTARLVAGGGLLALTLVGVGVGAWRVRGGAARHPWAVDVGELALLWVFFAVLPPVLAVGLYFTLWHALRHIARLLLVDPGSREALTAGDAADALGRFARDAAPLTAVSLLGFVGLALVVPGAESLGALADDPDGLLALYLVGIAVLTLPHVVVVTWMDRVQGVW
ncbi:Brp/Blh family beta-carotene 15,15'-dioxygenase [Salinigranum marinum]|uniref:Brp/Blh family beta-carotene 15,15'-dioxygenase n=1 Tax=Salinigranum marinum TaxID=1515595 RepID=UPI002989C4D6|nr:Brp/Blh family beta-carotene 15,15'-dioxygenase [Salinigranum marinum]